MVELLESLFDGDGSIPGRGEVRKIARRLRRYWSGFPASLQADRAVSDVIELAPFVWSDKFGFLRANLAGQILSANRSTLWLAGPGRFRNLVLERVDSYPQLQELLAGPEAKALWKIANKGGDSTSVGLSDEEKVQLVNWHRQSRLPTRLPLAELLDRRRSRSSSEAADAWTLVARSRLEMHDLSGADRAAGHALILRGATGDLSELLRRQAFLTQVRIRRGRLRGLPRILQQLESSSRAAGVAGRQVGVSLLRARFEMSRGMPATALERISRYEDECRRIHAQPDRLARVLEARALGWLGRAAEGRLILDGLNDEDWRHLEPEEKPALWALCGDLLQAREVAAPTQWNRLWETVVDGSGQSRVIWNQLAQLEDYRAARLVLDIELVKPGSVPDPWIQRAEACLRTQGAGAFAARLDHTRRGSWRVLSDYFGSRAGSGEKTVRRLIEEAGYFDSKLSWLGGTEQRVLIPGAGGPAELSEELVRGRLLLQAPRLDPPLRALFALAAREYSPNSGARRRGHRVGGLVGDSEKLHASLVRLERLATREMTLLVQGETGTGKEIAARQVHKLSPRSAGPFVAVNCAALSESLLLSELFGHVRGAFTGADRSRAGIFETAAGGTVFLDEIGDLPLQAQAKLLRVLQEGELRRLGESASRSVDIRVVAATHRDLKSMIDTDEFRSDLYYRLCVGSIVLPPLRNRGLDVVVLAEHFLAHRGYSMNAASGQHLLTHSWPGNVRELRNVIDLAVALCDGKIIRPEHLELPTKENETRIGYHRQVQDFRRSLVREALRASGGQRAEAARRLQLSRQALSYLARTLGVE
jgi:DNA-binding NtrC family response regulator